MTPEEITTRIKTFMDEDIGDNEALHANEDELHQEVLRYIAEECENIEQAKQLATAALRTIGYHFTRWYA